MNWHGLIIAFATFLIIGVAHPIVIKSEYHFGTRCWWVFLLVGISCVSGSLFIGDEIRSILLGVVGCTALWAILEIFEQKDRVKKGWFPMNPKRKDEYREHLLIITQRHRVHRG